jgi:hypothetical protein
MKKLAVIVVMCIAISTFTFSAYAMGMGGGMSGGMGGSGMTGKIGSGLLEWFQKWRNGSANTIPSGQESKQMDELDRQHNEDSAYMKYQIQMKEKQLDALLDSTNPDIEKIKALRRDIRELRVEADREQRNYEHEAGKASPGYRPGNGNGWGSYGSAGSMGSGGMMGNGQGGGMGGSGQGNGQGMGGMGGSGHGR